MSAVLPKRKSVQTSLFDYLPSAKRCKVEEAATILSGDEEASPVNSRSEAPEICQDSCAKEASSSSASPPTLQPVPEEPLLTPDCWSVQQWCYFKGEYEWIFLASGHIGCSVCRDVKATGGLSVHSCGQGLRISMEWADGKVGPSGFGKHARQKQLRKKIMEHKSSGAHKASQDILTARKNNHLTEVMQQSSGKHLESTCRVFHTVFYLTKKNRPFTDHPDLVDLQEVNGVEMGRVLRSNVTSTEIVRHIASEMQKKLVCYIREHKPKISVFVDESTTVSNKSTLIIYLRGLFGAHCKPVTIFFGLVDLQETNALAIKEALLGYFENVGITKTLLHEIWIAICSDGAAVMFGSKGGVITLLRAEFPNLVLSWHCLAHRLELAVGDTIDDVGGANHFKMFMDSLYATYSMSPKNTRQLQMAASDLGLQLQKIGKMLDTRWVASSYRTVQAVWNCFPALCKHIEEAAKDLSRPTRDRSKYDGLLKKLTSNSFVKDLGLMCDALQELKDLSLALQSRDITIVDAHRLLVGQVRRFFAMKESPGEFASTAQSAVDCGHFKGVHISQGRANSVSLNERQFYQSLSVNLAKRCAPDLDKELVASFSVLDAKNLPNDEDIVLYGENEIQRLCTKFQLPIRDTIHAFRDFKDFGGKRCLEAFRALVACMETLPASNADCERGFSAMNLIASPSRASLHVATISSCLWLKLNGPPVKAFKPLSFVKSWLAKGRRTAEETHCEQAHAKKDSLEDYYVGFWEIVN
ncbi:E3 SUMO-protein ligase KIAA1586-like [Ambystoma mexicanum]|uniref:E3 SUMO-protein ligase KIAA1586-like n=1 Tax=Ambystoma mexicanum TaxID=8296 RepID=UPI0037E7AA72